MGSALDLARRVAALNPDAGEIGPGMLAQLVADARAVLNLPSQDQSAVDDALERAALAVTDHKREGREWVPGSLWDTLSHEAAARVRALKSPKAG